MAQKEVYILVSTTLIAPNKDQYSLLSTPYIALFLFTPDHLVDYAGVGLNDLNHLSRNVFFNIVRYGNAEVTAYVHFHRSVNRPKKSVLVNARKNEARLIKSLGTLSGGSNTNRRKRLAYTGKERAFLRESSAVRNNSKRVHLQTIIVMEA